MVEYKRNCRVKFQFQVVMSCDCLITDKAMFLLRFKFIFMFSRRQDKTHRSYDWGKAWENILYMHDKRRRSSILHT